jgi:molybdopterin-containing oxidoreductase family membrane subunit
MSADEQVLLRPLIETSRGFKITAAVLAGITLWGAIAYYLQVRYGLGRTGLNRPEYWGIYIICFVFFIGISHAGTLISAILRVCKAEWRRSITRSAELITVLVIGFGAIQPVIDLGRPDRMLNIFLHAQLLSPLLWDVISIGHCLTWRSSGTRALRLRAYTGSWQQAIATHRPSAHASSVSSASCPSS